MKKYYDGNGNCYETVKLSDGRIQHIEHSTGRVYYDAPCERCGCITREAPGYERTLCEDCEDDYYD